MAIAGAGAVSRTIRRFPYQAGWLENAQQRAERSSVRDTGGRVVAGVDVGGGEAETVVCLCELGKPNPKVIKFGAWRGQDTRGQVVNFLTPYRDRLSLVRVDADGIGHNFALHLRSEGFKVEFVRVGLRVESRPGPDDPSLRFFNFRAQCYQRMADLLQRDELDGLRDATTIGQLAGIRYELDGSGRIKIESKESARQRGVRSPDRADALMLALGNHRPEITMKDLLILPKRAQGGPTPTGSVMIMVSTIQNRVAMSGPIAQVYGSGDAPNRQRVSIRARQGLSV